MTILVATRYVTGIGKNTQELEMLLKALFSWYSSINNSMEAFVCLVIFEIWTLVTLWARVVNFSYILCLFIIKLGIIKPSSNVV